MCTSTDTDMVPMAGWSALDHRTPSPTVQPCRDRDMDAREDLRGGGRSWGSLLWRGKAAQGAVQAGRGADKAAGGGGGDLPRLHISSYSRRTGEVLQWSLLVATPLTLPTPPSPPPPPPSPPPSLPPPPHTLSPHRPRQTAPPRNPARVKCSALTPWGGTSGARWSHLS